MVRPYAHEAKPVACLSMKWSRVQHFLNFILQAEKQAGSPWLAILQREYRAQLVLAIAMPLFQMATGINAVVFFSPQLFGGIGSFGEGAKGGLVASAVIGAVQVCHGQHETTSITQHAVVLTSHGVCNLRLASSASLSWHCHALSCCYWHAICHWLDISIETACVRVSTFH